jgi:hypothetical protein
VTIRRSLPRAMPALREIVRQAGAGARSVVVQAGHLLLYYDERRDRVLPCLATELTDESQADLRRDVGGFPIFSYQLGLTLIDDLAADAKYVMTVVNDWQYLPKGVDRQRFYGQQRSLPAAYSAELERYEGRIELLAPHASAGTAPFFGEMNLRNQFNKSVERMLRSDELPPGLEVDRLEGGTVCRLPDQLGRRQEVYCSNRSGDCAAEIAQMLRIAKERVGCDLFVNLYPLVCRDFVEAGTELGERLLGNGVAHVLNVGLPSHGVASIEALLRECEVAWHSFE